MKKLEVMKRSIDLYVAIQCRKSDGLPLPVLREFVEGGEHWLEQKNSYFCHSRQQVLIGQRMRYKSCALSTSSKVLPRTVA